MSISKQAARIPDDPSSCLRLDFGSPINTGRVSPEMFQVVNLPRFRREHMQNNIAVVLKNPGITAVSFESDAAGPFGFKNTVYLLDNGVHLAPAGPGRDDKIVDDRRDGSQIKNECVFAFVVVGNFRTEAGMSKTALPWIRSDRLG